MLALLSFGTSRTFLVTLTEKRVGYKKRSVLAKIWTIVFQYLRVFLTNN